MASTNKRAKDANPQFTHEGARAARMTQVQALRRSVMSCMLWENEFYENGVAIADRIKALSSAISPSELASIAIEAREVAKLRHVPLLLLTNLIKTGSGSSLVSETISKVIQRADELSELLSLYWKVNGKDASLAKQLRVGLAQAFTKFDAYQLAKYNRDNEVRLRDVLFLSHAKPKDEAQAEVFKKLVDGTLESPDTWEVSLSAGSDKRETFERLLTEGKLGYLALLRNLRNMDQAGVDRSLVIKAILARKGADRVLPFRFIAAARAAPTFETALDQALIASIEGTPKLSGRTLVLVDVSGSMDARLSSKSDLSRVDAAATLAAVISAEDLSVYSFSNRTVAVPARRGMAGVEAILRSQTHGGTNLSEAVAFANKQKHDRLIVITDEQASGYYGSRVPDPVVKNAYMINVASAKNGVGYGKWRHIDGFSENVLRFIAELESSDLSDLQDA